MSTEKQLTIQEVNKRYPGAPHAFQRWPGTYYGEPTYYECVKPCEPARLYCVDGQGFKYVWLPKRRGGRRGPWTREEWHRPAKPSR